MSNYVANEWQNGDKIYAEDMNRIDGGVEDLYNVTDDLQEQINEIEPGGGSDAFVLNLVWDDGEVDNLTGLVYGSMSLDEETLQKLSQWAQENPRKQVIVNGTINVNSELYTTFQATGYTPDTFNNNELHFTSPVIVAWVDVDGGGNYTLKTMFTVQISEEGNETFADVNQLGLEYDISLGYTDATRLAGGFISANITSPLSVQSIMELTNLWSNLTFILELYVNDEAYNWRINDVAVCNEVVTVTTPIYFNTYSQSYNVIMITGQQGEDADTWRFEEIVVAEITERE